MSTQIEEKKLLFLPSGTKAKQVSEEEYDNYDQERMKALNITEFIRVAGKENEVLTLTFLHDFRYRTYEGKNFHVMYLTNRDPLHLNVEEFYFDDYFEAKRKFDFILMNARKQ